MKTPNRLALTVCIAVIILYWVWILVHLGEVPTIPSTFSDFVWVIARNKLITIGVISALLIFQQQGAESVGLTSKDWIRHLFMGLLFGTVMFFVINVVLTSVMNSIFSSAESGAGVMQFFKDPGNLVIWLPVGIFAGGFIEEVQRIFVLTRFEQWNGKTGLVIALILTSVFFGIGHLYQGIGSAISTGIGGLCFGLIFLRRRSALEAIAAHAFSDVLAILAAAWLVR